MLCDAFCSHTALPRAKGVHQPRGSAVFSLKTNSHSDRASLETFGLVHEHKCATLFYVSCTLPARAKKRAPKIHMGAPITMAATPADHAGAAVAL